MFFLYIGQVFHGCLQVGILILPRWCFGYLKNNLISLFIFEPNVANNSAFSFQQSFTDQRAKGNCIMSQLKAITILRKIKKDMNLELL